MPAFVLRNSLYYTPLNIYTIEDYKPHLRFVIFKGIAHEIYIRTLKGADINLRWSKMARLMSKKHSRLGFLIPRDCQFDKDI